MANGLSVEFYGKGLTLGPDAGIGQTLYSGLDYLELLQPVPQSQYGLCWTAFLLIP